MDTDRRSPTPSVSAIELRELRYFRRGAERRSFTQAAAELHLAQQALSTAVARLEGRLGLRLLDRTTRRVDLTPAGAALLTALPAVFNALDSAFDAAHDAALAAGEQLRVVVAPDGLPPALGLVERFAAADPNVDVVLRELQDTDALAAVHTGRADIAVVWRRAPESVDLPGQLLTELETGIVMQRDDPLAGRTTVDAHDLAGHRLVLFARDLSPGIYDDLLRAPRPAGIQGAPVAVSHAVRPGQVAMIDAVATGGGFTSATSLAFDQLDRDDVMLVGFDPPFTAALELVWRDGATVATRALLSVAGRADVSSPTPGRTSQPDQPT